MVYKYVDLVFFLILVTHLLFLIQPIYIGLTLSDLISMEDHGRSHMDRQNSTRLLSYSL